MTFPVEQTHIDYRLVTRSGLMIRPVLTDFSFVVASSLILFGGGR